MAHLAFLLVIARAVDFTSQAEVGDLDDAIVGQQNVAGRQIAVEHLSLCNCMVLSPEYAKKSFGHTSLRKTIAAGDSTITLMNKSDVHFVFTDMVGKKVN